VVVFGGRSCCCDVSLLGVDVSFVCDCVGFVMGVVVFCCV